MRACSRYAILKTDETAAISTLARDGHVLAVPFDGAYLEAQFELDDRQTLICLSDGSPYDAGLNLYLLAGDGSVVDSVEGGAAYAAGIFKAKQSGDTWLDFQFFTNDATYRVSVLPQSRFRFSLPAGWKYKHRLHPHRLLLEAMTTGKS